jgi:hypothetical protein
MTFAHYLTVYDRGILVRDGYLARVVTDKMLREESMSNYAFSFLVAEAALIALSLPCHDPPG